MLDLRCAQQQWRPVLVPWTRRRLYQGRRSWLRWATNSPRGRPMEWMHVDTESSRSTESHVCAQLREGPGLRKFVVATTQYSGVDACDNILGRQCLYGIAFTNLDVPIVDLSSTMLSDLKSTKLSVQRRERSFKSRDSDLHKRVMENGF